MRHKIMTFFLSIIVIILIGIIILLCWLLYTGNTVEDIYKEVTRMLNIETAQTDLNEKYEVASSEEDLDSEQSFQGKFYYKQLTDTQKILYDGFEKNKENMKSGTYIIEFGDVFSDILEKEDGSKRLQADYQSAIEAYTHDNSDIFYLDITKLFLNIETTKKIWNTRYNVYIGPVKGSTYYADEYKNENQVKEAYNQIEEVKTEILSRLGKNNYENIKMIHDYLIDNIDYDQKLESVGTYSIYGALINKKCVCDGYARTFKFLANAAGYECEIVQGLATNDSNNIENHAWNAIKLDDRWYYIDVTWDDPVIIGNGYVPSYYYYRYFLKGSKTFDNNHVLDGKFSEGGKEFSFPYVSILDYKK